MYASSSLSTSSSFNVRRCGGRRCDHWSHRCAASIWPSTCPMSPDRCTARSVSVSAAGSGERGDEATSVWSFGCRVAPTKKTKHDGQMENGLKRLCIENRQTTVYGLYLLFQSVVPVSLLIPAQPSQNWVCYIYLLDQGSHAPREEKHACLQTYWVKTKLILIPLLGSMHHI